MYKEDTSFTIKTGVENMSPKEVVNLLRQTVWAKDRKKRGYHQIIQSFNLLRCIYKKRTTSWICQSDY